MAETTTNGHSQTYVGTRTVRPDGHDKVTGRARFGSDFDLPGQLIGRVRRSAHPPARVVAEPNPEKPSHSARRSEIKQADAEAGFKTADVIGEREFKTAPVHQGY